MLAPSGERVSLAQLCKIAEQDGGSEIYREGNQRYVAIKYSVRGRDLGSTVEEAIKKVNARVQLPRGYHIEWEGEYESQKRAQARIFLIVPLTILVIFLILYTMFRSIKWALLILANVALAGIGGSFALFVAGTNFSVSSASASWRFLAYLCKPASSCSNISINSAHEATQSRTPRLKEPS